MAFPIILAAATVAGLLVAAIARSAAHTSNADPRTTYTIVAVWGEASAIAGPLPKGSHFAGIPTDVRMESDPNGPYTGPIPRDRARMFMNKLSGDPPNAILVLDAMATVVWVIARRELSPGHVVENEGAPPINLL